MKFGSIFRYFQPVSYSSQALLNLEQIFDNT